MKIRFFALIFISSLFLACSVNNQATTKAEDSLQAAGGSASKASGSASSGQGGAGSSAAVSVSPDSEKEGFALGKKIGLFFSNIGDKIKLAFAKFGGLFSEEVKSFLFFLLIAIPVLLFLSFIYWLLFSGVLDNNGAYSRRTA